MYAKCGALAKAQETFDELRLRTVVSWNALISGYAQYDRNYEVIRCFEQMQEQGCCPDAITFTCVLKVCGNVGTATKGEQIHAEVVCKGMLQKDIILANALLDMYVKCESVKQAQEVFDDLPCQDVVSWNALIAGYALLGHGYEALDCFVWMQKQGFTPDAITYTCVLKACTGLGAMEKGEELYAGIIKLGLMSKDTILGTALVDMYAKCGALAKAQVIFDGLMIRDIVSWDALIAGYAQHKYDLEALKCFEELQHDGISPDATTYICVLKVCGSLGILNKGEEIHAEIARKKLLQKDTVLGTSLVDMYAKCGALKKAAEVFDELLFRDIVSWSALIAGYSQLGKVEFTFNSFNIMVGEGIEPNTATFLVLLSACSHAGLVDEGQRYFAVMSRKYDVIPTREHCTCMVDLYGRAGHFDKAMGVVVGAAPTNHLPLWSALLTACKNWGNMELGRLAFKHLLYLDEKDTGAYICMRNILAASSTIEAVDRISSYD